MPEFIDENPEAEQVLKIYYQVYPTVDFDDPEAKEKLVEDFIDGQEAIVARNDDGRIVGVANYDFPANKDYLYLSGIAVAKSMQGLGVGAIILENLKQTAKEDGRQAVEGKALDSAASFYRRIGAEVINDRLRYEF